jgi:cell division protein FtsB
MTHLPFAPIVVGAALLAAAYFGYSTYHYVAHNYQLADDEAAIEREIAELDARHAQLVAVRDYLKSDEYVEYVARNTLGLVRPGETLVVVSSSAPAAPSATPSASEERDTAPWWQELFVGPEEAPTSTVP